MYYNIKKGKNSSGFRFRFTLKKKVSFGAIFDDSCLYKPFPHPDTKDINKLCGFATTIFHQKQSGRVGWRCVDNSGEIELVTYSYDSWKRDISDQNVLGRVKPKEYFIVTIEDFETYYLYTLNYLGKIRTNKDHKKPDKFPIKYILNPFFGGNNPAPHDMMMIVTRK